MSSPVVKKFYAPDALSEALAQIAAVAQREGVRVALAGGYAMQLYGSDRLTGDLDLLADKKLSLPPVKSLSFGGEQVEADNGVPVDLIRRDDDYASLYDEALDTAVITDGISAPVVRSEYLAAMKLAAGRGKDDLDLAFLVTSGAVDLPTARKIIKKLLGAYAAQEFDSAVSEAQWRKATGR